MAAQEAAPMPPLEQYVAEYWEKGWTVVPNVLSPNEADELAELLLEICEEERQAFIAAHGALRNDGMTDMGPDGTSTPRKTGDPFHKRARFQELATDGRLRAVAASMLRRPALIFSDQAFCKGPRVGGEKPRHQDNYYFGMDDSDCVITCWTALDDGERASTRRPLPSSDHISLYAHMAVNTPCGMGKLCHLALCSHIYGVAAYGIVGLDNGCMRLIRGAYRNGLVDHVRKQKAEGMGEGG